MVENVPRERWAPRLARFTETHAGRRVDLEVETPQQARREAERDHRLYGVSWDRHDGDIQIMLGEFGRDAEGGAGPHLTHTVRDPRYVDIVTDEEGRETALRIAGEREEALLRLHHGP